MLPFSFTFEALGAQFDIATSSELTQTVKQKILTSVEDFDAEFSRFRDDSRVRAMSDMAGEYEFSARSEPLFEWYESLYKATGGKVTPLIGGSLEALGYDAQYSLVLKDTQGAPDFSDVLSRSETTLTAHRPVLYDAGAAGKGFIVDEIAKILKDNAITEYLVDGSGDIVHSGDSAETVGLEDPLNQGKVIGQVELKNKALCASAVNRRQWGDGLHHVVDPTTGLPTKEVIATWVMADTAMIADGLSTALFFISPDTLKDRYNYEYMRVFAGGTIEFSKAFETALY